MRIFLAGATGLVVRRAAPPLVAAGHEVTALGRNPEKRRQLKRMGARPVTVDLFAAEAVRNAVTGHDAVINIATHIPPDEPLTHRNYVDSLAAALDVPPPRLPPAWMTPIFGSIGRLLADRCASKIGSCVARAIGYRASPLPGTAGRRSPMNCGRRFLRIGSRR